MDAAAQLEALLRDTASVSFAEPDAGVARPSSPGLEDPLTRVGGGGAWRTRIVTEDCVSRYEKISF
jgi:hypothetical protein